MKIRYITLLRAINVGGRNCVAMDDLKKLFADLGFADTKTLLQSGNVVFSGNRQSTVALEKKLEAEFSGRLGITIDFVVLTADEWNEIIAYNPFPKEAKDDPGHLVVMCMKTAPTAANIDTLQSAIKGRETFRADGKQLYIVYPDGIGTSKFTNTLIEKKLEMRGTARNWNTVLKLHTLLQPPA